MQITIKAGLHLAALLIFLLISSASLEGFDKVVIWGHKLHSHTHSYIHNAFHRAFIYLGYPTYWFDDQDDVSDFDFSGSLFITEGQVDKNIPLRTDCQYMLHNCDWKKYKVLDRKKYFAFQVYNDTIHRVPNLIKIDTCIYYHPQGYCLYMPWATDLLPDEIEANKRSLTLNQDQKTIYWVGTYGDGVFGNISELAPFIRACEENGIDFKVISPGKSSIDDNIRLIRDSYIAPAIVGAWQKEKGYIPCRIFKNISYGQIGVTNSERVHELFEGRIIYNPDTYLLFYDAKKYLETRNIDEQIALMDFVKEKHTYLNRIETMLAFLKLVENE